LALSAAAPSRVSAQPTATQVDWDAVAAAIGVPGTMQSGGVYRIDLPRSDLNVMIGHIRLKPAFALSGYLVFLPTRGSNAMMMGDLVLTEREIEPVMAKLAQGGVDVTAVHNHLLWEKPTVMYVHVEASGDAVQLAQVVHGALATSRTPLRAAASTNETVDLDTVSLDQTIGVAGKASGGVYSSRSRRSTP